MTYLTFQSDVADAGVESSQVYFRAHALTPKLHHLLVHLAQVLSECIE